MDKKDPSEMDSANKMAGKVVGALLKKAVSMGAGAYVAAEDTVHKTLGAAQMPKEMLKEALESFLDSYTITVQAEVKFTPKKKEKSHEP